MGSADDTPKTLRDVVAKAAAEGKVTILTDRHGTASVRVPVGALERPPRAARPKPAQ